MRRSAVALVALSIVMLAAQPVSAANKCLVWVWIDGWRCAVGI